LTNACESHGLCKFKKKKTENRVVEAFELNLSILGKKRDLIEKWKFAIIEHLVLLVLSRFQNYKFFPDLDEDTICFFIDNKRFRIARRHLCEG
jgi:hypothetical protein